MVFINQFIKKEHIVFLETTEKFESISKLCDALKNNENITDFEKFKKAIIARENILTTGIGYEIAIPHVKIDCVKEFVIVIGINKNGIEWNSLDGKPVKLIFLIAGPENHNKYLNILAKITLIARSKEIKEKIINSKSTEEVVEILKDF